MAGPSGKARSASGFALVAAFCALSLLPACTCTGTIDSGEVEDVDNETPGLARSALRRLTRAELAATLADVLPMVEPKLELIRALPEDSAEIFDNDATEQAASQLLIDTLNAIAEDAAVRLVANVERREELLGCTPAGPDDVACYDQFVRTFGRRVLRRPLGDDEVAAYRDAFLPLAAADGDFYAAVAGSISALLQDVEFVYRVEIGTPIEGTTTTVRLNGYEIATRLSYLLWGSTPDDALLDLAGSGRLATGSGRRDAALAMLDDPRAFHQIGRFHAMWIGYEHSLPTTSNIPEDIQRKLREEADAMFARVVLEDRTSWFDVFRMTETFVDDALATWYGDIPLPGSATAIWTSYGASGRGGLTSLGAYLNVGNKFVDTSPTQRGLMIRTRLLCGTVPAPDPSLMADVDALPPTTSGCKGDGYRALITTAGCGGCHAQMDSIGFGLERYDLGGRFRTFEPAGEQCPIDGNGTFLSASGAQPFNGPGDLARLLADTPELETCLVTQVFRFTQGRHEDTEDAATLTALADRFRNANARMDELLLKMVSAPGFAQHAVASE